MIKGPTFLGVVTLSNTTVQVHNWEPPSNWFFLYQSARYLTKLEGKKNMATVSVGVFETPEGIQTAHKASIQDRAKAA